MSRHNARLCDVVWVRSIVAQCRTAGVPCFIKQLGSRPYLKNYDEPDPGPAITPNGQRMLTEDATDDGSPLVEWVGRVHLHDPKGADPAEWPADICVREVPA